MAERFVVGSTTYMCAANATSIPREWRRFTLGCGSEDILQTLTRGAACHREWDSAVYDESGNQTGTEVLTEDLADYCIFGDVIDHRDGTVTVCMGKKTDAEIYQETIDTLLLEILIGGL